MPHWRQMMDRPTLGAWDFLDAEGKSVDKIARIKAVNAEMLEGIPGKIAANRKPVLTLEDGHGVEWGRKLICGVTICQAIEGMYGSNPAGWPGKLITLYASTTKGQRGGTVECVRVRPTPPKRKGQREPVADDAPSGPVDEAMRQRQIDEASALVQVGTIVGTGQPVYSSPTLATPAPGQVTTREAGDDGDEA